MITDLIELTRVRLGSGIVITPAKTCLRRICAHVIEEMKAIYPQRSFQLNGDDEIDGEWDEAKMSQVLSNLLGNAVQHGNLNAPITVTARRGTTGVDISVHNEGTTIPADMLPRLFDSLFRGSSDQRAADDNTTSLGLGLYIAKEIVSAHAGTIEVRSSDSEGTTFAVHLPQV
jgi:signal transduction histidine kinase